MSIDSTLKKEGINVIGELNTLDINKIASNIADKICSAFPEHNLNQSDLFISIARLNMYVAEMPDSSAGAKYYYKNNSIYFNKNMDLDSLNALSLHECIHFIQELKDKHGKLLRMGLYDLSNRNKNGMALNEAAVQLMASLANKTVKDTVKYYNMEFTTESPDFYPIETALIKQMIYFTGSYPLFHSTLFSNDIYKNTFISKSSSSTYNKIEYNFDLLMHYQEELSLASFKLSNMSEDKKISKVRKLNEKINVLKEVILNKTLEIQKIILTECFNKEFLLIRNADDIKLFKARLNNFSSALITNENDTTYNDYCSEMMLKLADKKAFIEKYGELTYFEASSTTDLSVLESESYGFKFFKILFSKLSLLLEERLRSKSL